MSDTAQARLQVKVCGLTRADEAVACAEAGADAIGLVFYPPSPRFVEDSLAREIGGSLPDRVARIGVFVNESTSTVMKRVESCALTGVQLHGRESLKTVRELNAEGVLVIKSVFTKRVPTVADACLYEASAYLVESGEGPLPGGNAIEWDWGSARKCLGWLPCILAGGLTVENVAEAVGRFHPDAVDVSSGVEFAPGRKDIAKVELFVQAVHGVELPGKPRRIF